MKGNVRNLESRVFGKWTVLTRGENYKNGSTRWNCRCQCGLEKLVLSTHLVSGQSKSCSKCSTPGGPDARAYKHGAKGGIYACWSNMIQRCENSNHPQFKDYGGRGITVCERWRRDYAAFLADMGPRPFPGAHIDRKDNDGGYDPANCHWVTRVENMRNKRNSRRNEHA